MLPAITKILTKVNSGSELEIYLPPETAYGEQGVPGLIPGDATLVFNIKILNLM
ncbi:FKBP-type peptidyl-prolyl cis-trans isomerase [Serratia marcescens]|uniref:FKBP-type peptidyl-prolyl cis-trans isomerase n=1 Tax=Serratia marcescens TaxID=615 RepID=UPI0034D30F0F